MHRSIFHKIASLAAAGAALSTFATGCTLISKQEIPDISQEKVRDDVKSTLNKNDFAVDEVTEITLEPRELSAEEMEELQAKVTGNLVARKVISNFTATSPARGIKGTYALIYVYANSEWMLTSATIPDPSSWIYSAKAEVQVSKIREDLLTIDFEGIGTGKVGEESTTEVTVTGRMSDIENGNDNVDLTIRYTTPFATYKIKGRLQYKFVDGNWVMTGYSTDEQSFWDVEFDESSMPPEPKDDYIISLLTDSSNYRSYMMNPSYVENHYISHEPKTMKGTTVNYNSTLIVTYKNFGEVEYNVTKPYTWVDGSWEEDEIQVTVKTANWSNMLHTWASINGDFVRFTEADKNTLIGTYTHKFESGQFVTYDVTAEVEIEKTDNNWSLVIEQGKVSAGDENEHFVILPFEMDFEKGVIKSNGSIYTVMNNEDLGPGFSADPADIVTTVSEEPEETELGEDFDSGLTFFGETPETASVESEMPEETETDIQ